MNANLYRQSVTLRRPKAGTRDADGSVEYEIVVDSENQPVEIRCTLQIRGRRLFDARGVEIQTDAALVFRQREGLELKIDDIVVDVDGVAYKVIGLDVQKLTFGAARFGRADLQKTVDPVAHDLEVYGE